MNVLTDLLNDLREKRLWPLAVLLLVAIIAVPVLLSNSSKPVPAAATRTPAVSALPGLPVVSAQSTPSSSHLTGPSRDPFSGSGSSTTSTASTTSTTGTTTSSTTSSSKSGTASGGTSAPSTGTSAPSTTTAPKSIVPAGTPAPKPAPGTLEPSQSYEVALAITNASGGLNTIDPLKRLSVLPNDQQPLLVEMGVLKGGRRVMFAVQPGTVVNGPGVCTPGPIDCEVMSLALDQTESLSQQTPTGVNQVALFAVTNISAADHNSTAAADKARRREDSAGRAVLNHSTLDALSLFQYQPSLGVVVDLRNLQVGG